MTKAEYKEVVTPNFIRNFFHGCIVEEGSAKYAITVAGKIITIGGKIFFETREQAIKGFYNSFSWRVKRELWSKTHPNGDRYSWWRNPEGTEMWKAFKEVLKEQYGFDIIQL